MVDFCFSAVLCAGSEVCVKGQLLAWNSRLTGRGEPLLVCPVSPTWIGLDQVAAKAGIRN